MSAQEAAGSTNDAATQRLDVADTNGDGVLSVDEIQAAMASDEAASTEDVAQAVSKLDTDGDGELNKAELSSGLTASREANRPRGPHGPPPSSADMATDLLSSADADGDGALGLAEITSALGDGADESGLGDKVKALDADADGKLNAAELKSALDAFRATQATGRPWSGRSSASAVSMTA